MLLQLHKQSLLHPHRIYLSPQITYSTYSQLSITLYFHNINPRTTATTSLIISHTPSHTFSIFTTPPYIPMKNLFHRRQQNHSHTSYTRAEDNESRDQIMQHINDEFNKGKLSEKEFKYAKAKTQRMSRQQLKDLCERMNTGGGIVTAIAAVAGIIVSASGVGNDPTIEITSSNPNELNVNTNQATYHQTSPYNMAQQVEIDQFGYKAFASNVNDANQDLMDHHAYAPDYADYDDPDVADV